MKFTLLFAAIIIASPLAQAKVLLDEKALIKMAEKETPSTKIIAAQQQSAAALDSLTQDRFNPKFSATYNYASSREDAIIQFAPVFRPQKNFQVGIQKQFSLGMKVNTGVFGQQLSTADGFINNATQVGAQLGLEIDLWKNFLGRLDRAELQSKKLNREISTLQSQIDKHSFLIDIRKAYWAMVANELSLNLSKQLVQSAKKQLAVSKRRARDGAADKGDVSRNQAQVQSRESAILFFSYQREVYFAHLKSLLPDLADKEIQVSMAARSSMEQKAKACMDSITKMNSIDSGFSQYTKIISLLDQRSHQENRLAQSTDSMDIKLMGQYQASGVDNNHDTAYERFTDQFKNGYQVGVAVTIPIGSDLRKARESRVLAVNNQITAQKERLDLQLRSEHQKVRKALSLLSQALKSQGGTVKSLSQSLKQTQRKYRQARVPLNTLILEQDNLFNAQLQEIDTKKQILHLLLDYFKVFPQHPCQVNTKMGAQS